MKIKELKKVAKITLKDGKVKNYKN